MSTSRGSVKSAGELLLDADGWKSEAEAIIRDVGEFVKVIQVSDMLEVRKRTREKTISWTPINQSRVARRATRLLVSLGVTAFGTHLL